VGSLARWSIVSSSAIIALEVLARLFELLMVPKIGSN
jgi:hypothetical protein